MFEQRAQRTMDAFSRKDLTAIMRPWADDSVLEFMGHTPISGRFEGRPAIEGFFRQVFDGVDTIRIRVRHVAFANPIGFSYNNTVFIEYEVDATNRAGAAIHDERIAVFEYRHGKVVSMREWAFDPTIVESMWGRTATQA